MKDVTAGGGIEVEWEASCDKAHRRFRCGITEVGEGGLVIRSLIEPVGVTVQIVAGSGRDASGG